MTTLFLRNKKRETVVDIDIWTKGLDDYEDKFTEIQASVILGPFLDLAMENQHRLDEVKKDFSELDDLRSWLWERRLHRCNDGTQTDKIIDEVADMMGEVGVKYGLAVVQD